MAFTTALYYPWIEVQDEGWLKNSLLYWDSIQTIVPYSITNPYSTKTSSELYNQGILIPYFVDSSSEEIRSLKEQVLEYLESDEGSRLLLSDEISETDIIHTEKLPYDLDEIVRIHPKKLPYAIQNYARFHHTSDGFIPVNRRFANFYMTLLATKISEISGLGLLCEETINDQLATSVKLDAKVKVMKQRMNIERARANYNDMNRGNYSERHNHVPKQLAQGVLADLIIEAVKVDPDTPVSKIIKFRKDHADELGLLRQKVEELTKSISNDLPINYLRQHVSDIYINQVKPAINMQKKALDQSGLKWVVDSCLKVSLLSFSASSFMPTMFGLSVPQALFTATGISFIASSVLYNLEKQSSLRNNPFSYVMKANSII